MKSILITGASTGMGADLAKLFLAEGHQVFLLARSADKLQTLQSEYGERAVVLAADISDLSQMQTAEALVKTKTSSLDICILNAGTCDYIDAKNFHAKDFESVNRVNWIGCLHSLEVFLPLLLAAEKPHLVGISSLATVLSLPRSQAYGSSKAAFEYCLRSLEVDLFKQGLFLTLVRPGFVDTPLTRRNDFPMPFIIDSDKAAKIIKKGIEKRKRMIEFPGIFVTMMKLIAWLPRFLQIRLLQKTVRH